MRTHFLDKLDVPGRQATLAAFPNFDFYNLSRVTRLSIDWRSQPAAADLALTAIYRDKATQKTGEVTLRFRGARFIQLPELAPFMFLAEFEVEDVSGDQLDGIKYRAKNFGSMRFEVQCGEINVDPSSAP